MLKRNLPSILAVTILLTAWQLVCLIELVPPYMLPSPLEVLQAFGEDFPLLWENSLITLQEAFIGLFLGVSIAFGAAVLMDEFDILYKIYVNAIVYFLF